MKDYLHEIARELVPVSLVMVLAAGCGAIFREETLIGEAEAAELRAVHEARQTALCAPPHPSPSATPSASPAGHSGAE